MTIHGERCRDLWGRPHGYRRTHTRERQVRQAIVYPWEFRASDPIRRRRARVTAVFTQKLANRMRARSLKADYPKGFRNQLWFTSGRGLAPSANRRAHSLSKRWSVEDREDKILRTVYEVGRQPFPKCPGTRVASEVAYAPLDVYNAIDGTGVSAMAHEWLVTRAFFFEDDE